jgi:hypothetical protein
MSQSNLLLATARRIATEERTVDGDQVHFQNVATVGLGLAPLYAGRYLRNGSSAALNVDGSTTPVAFALAAGDSEVLRVLGLQFVIQAATAPELTEFGDGAALTNGLTLLLLDSSAAAIVDVLDGEPVKSNLDLAAVCSSFEVVATSAAYAIVATLEFPIPLRIDGGAAETLRLTVSDNLTGLTSARCRALAYDEGALR